MTTQSDVSGAPADDLYVIDLWDDIWRARLLIVLGAFLFAALAAITVLLLPSWYRAEVVLVQAEERTSLGPLGQLGGLAAISGIASLAGITVGGGDTAEALAVLKSRDLTRAFIKEQNLLPILFADEWDAETGKWKQTDPKKQPDLRDAVRYFDRKIRTVREDRRTKVVRLEIEWKDAELAARWANLLADRLNAQMRARALLEAETNLKYLQGELEKADSIPLQQSISSLIEREMEKVMLARGTRDFAFRIIDRAEVPKRRSKPQRVLSVLAGGVFGGMLATAYVGLRAIRQRRAAALSRFRDSELRRG